MQKAPKLTKHVFTVLAVLPDNDNKRLFLRVVDHPKIAAEVAEGNLKVMTTTYEDFVNNKHEDEYDAVAMVFMKDFKKLDLQDMQDYIEFYALVPVIYLFVPMPKKNVQQNEVKQLLEGITYLQQSFNQKLIDQLPTFLSLDQNENAEQFLCGVRTMDYYYNEKKENEVQQCFKRFDLDGSGSIDKEELAALSLKLGHQLN